MENKKIDNQVTKTTNRDLLTMAEKDARNKHLEQFRLPTPAGDSEAAWKHRREYHLRLKDGAAIVKTAYNAAAAVMRDEGFQVPNHNQVNSEFWANDAARWLHGLHCSDFYSADGLHCYTFAAMMGSKEFLSNIRRLEGSYRNSEFLEALVRANSVYEAVCRAQVLVMADMSRADARFRTVLNLSTGSEGMALLFDDIGEDWPNRLPNGWKLTLTSAKIPRTHNGISKHDRFQEILRTYIRNLPWADGLVFEVTIQDLVNVHQVSGYLRELVTVSDPSVSVRLDKGGWGWIDAVEAEATAMVLTITEFLILNGGCRT